MTREEAISFLQSRIDLIDKYYPEVKDYREALTIAINELEQARWIPCSERLPEKNGDYLVTFKLSFMNFVEVCTFDQAGWNKGGYDEVIAWMSLPEVYRGGESE